MLKVVVKSSGFALIEGATAAIAVPPQIAVPEASRYASFFLTPRNFPRNITAEKVMTTNKEIQGT